jgi:spore germination protein
LLGLPNYGYDWTLPHIQGRTAAETISNIEAANRANRAGTEVQYNETVQSPHFNYTDGNGTMREVWFDDERSTRVKLEVVNEFNLAGVGIWTIMNPFPVGIEVMNELFTVTKV